MNIHLRKFRNYYWSSAMTTGRTFTVGLSIDIDRFVKVF